MSVAELPIPLDREKIAAFCRARGIRKLSLFGSVLRDDFDPGAQRRGRAGGVRARRAPRPEVFWLWRGFGRDHRAQGGFPH